MITIYASIGNSDDKLTQSRWASYIAAFTGTIESFADHVHGIWFSAPDSRFQNVAVCFEIAGTPGDLGRIKGRLSHIRETYQQDSIAWAVVAGETEFI